jgi:hypothetical protein
VTTEEIFRRILEALGRAGIPYMLTGSFASSYHGIPRATQDIDLVIAPTASQLRHLVRLLPNTEYYISEDAALDALAHEGQFNVVDFATGWKIDLIIRKSRPFSRTEFDRRSAVDLFGVQFFIASAEDVLLAKLEWARSGRSMRQLEDCGNLLRARWDELDRAYTEHWVTELGLHEQWQQVQKMAGVG